MATWRVSSARTFTSFCHAFKLLALFFSFVIRFAPPTWIGSFSSNRLTRLLQLGCGKNRERKCAVCGLCAPYKAHSTHEKLCATYATAGDRFIVLQPRLKQQQQQRGEDYKPNRVELNFKLNFISFCRISFHFVAFDTTQWHTNPLSTDGRAERLEQP